MMKAAKEEWTEEQYKNGLITGNSEEAYNILKALTKTNSISQQSLKTAAETSGQKAQLL